MDVRITPGPWAQGRVLETPLTRRLSIRDWKQAEEIEKCSVFANFILEDQGRSRKLVATCTHADDARVVALVPSLVVQLQDAQTAIEDAMQNLPPTSDCFAFLARVRKRNALLLVQIAA